MRASDACLIAVLALAGGCVPRDAGFSDVSRIVSHRTGHRVRWRAVDEEPAVLDAELRRLIAQPLDADEATRVALLNNPSLSASFEELGVARGRLLSAAVPPNPEVEGELYVPTDQGGGGEADFEGSAMYDVGALVRLPIRYAAAEAELSAARMRAASDVLDLALRVRVAFYGYLADQRERELLRDIVMAARASWEAATLLYEAGNVPRLDVAQQRALYEEARVALAQAELAVLEDREQLNVLMGLSGGETEWTVDAELADPPELPDLERLEARAIESSLALEELRFSAGAAAQRIGLARNLGAMPHVEVGGAIRREGGEWAAGAAASVSLPVFDQNLGAIEGEEARLRQLRNRHEATAIRVRSSIRRARNRLLNATERVRFYRETLLPVRQEVLDQTLLQYNAMQVDVFELITARRAQIQTSLDYVGALRDAWVAQAVLEQILAGGAADPGEVLGAPERPGLMGGAPEPADEH